MSRTQRFEMRLTPEEWSAWSALAKAAGVSVAVLVRRRMGTGPVDHAKISSALGSETEGAEPNLLPQMLRGKSGRRTASRHKAVPSPVVPDFTKGKS